MKRNIKFSKSRKVIAVHDYSKQVDAGLKLMGERLDGKQPSKEEYYALDQTRLLEKIEIAQKMKNDDSIMQNTKKFLENEKGEFSNKKLLTISLITSAYTGLVILAGTTWSISAHLLYVGIFANMQAIMATVLSFGRRLSIEKNLKALEEIKNEISSQSEQIEEEKPKTR